jgi:argininosuccinate lyase
MLATQKIIPTGDARKIEKALREIQKEIGSGRIEFSQSKRRKQGLPAEDIHMAVERRLIEKIGEIGGRLHTGRSRNDQVALDERLYLRGVLEEISAHIRRLQKTLLARAEQYDAVLMPGYTHLQRAQPVLLAHHMLAYVSMFERDHERFADCYKRVNRSPLGAGALAGTSFPIDRRRTAAALGFHNVIENSIDAVSDRDVLIEFVAACGITMMHLSRLAEELVLWASQEWHFAEIGDAFSTGSTIMPQKKNPDMAELVRGKTGRVYGDLVALLTVMKGLPLAYNRDMQEDKEPMFDAADTVMECLSIMSAMMKSVRFNKRRFDRELQSDFLLATEVADYLVRKGMPFRRAHAVAGNIVRFCEERGVALNALPLAEYRRRSKLFSDDVFKFLQPMTSLSNKKSLGSTSPREVRESIRLWKSRLR